MSYEVKKIDVRPKDYALPSTLRGLKSRPFQHKDLYVLNLQVEQERGIISGIRRHLLLNPNDGETLASSKQHLLIGPSDAHGGVVLDVTDESAVLKHTPRLNWSEPDGNQELDLGNYTIAVVQKGSRRDTSGIESEVFELLDVYVGLPGGIPTFNAAPALTT